MRGNNSVRREECLGPKRSNSYSGTVRTFSQGRAIKGLFVCYVVWLGSMKSMGLVPCCGQDGYRVLQHPLKT